ncbi:hypothetical protein H633G_00029 [Metarhizium anisopliae BRIP 53284]|nr:hypothetical protein H633G_00029 [Metarhizium anisopliae BRIP 53284]
MGENFKEPDIVLPCILTVTLHEAPGLSALHGKLRYALLNYDKCEVPVQPYLVSASDSVLVQKDYNVCKFYVARLAELTISFYVRDPEDAPAVLLGVARVKPFSLSKSANSHWLPVGHDCAARVRVSFEYHRALQEPKFRSLGGDVIRSRSRYVGVFKSEDIGQRYADGWFSNEHISSPGLISFLPSQINHPFIAPVTHSYESEYESHLLSPYVGGGHLFHHIQNQRRFDTDISRLYIAEILCALEYIHDFHSIFGWLKPQNVLLDLSGHIVLCGFGLFILEAKNRDSTTPRVAEYPAPELLLGNDATRPADYWTLGIFLYEMLVGEPLFYDENPTNITEKILKQPLEFPGNISTAAKDLITRLLNRRPQERLGAHGASEIKNHSFFESINWQKVLQRNYEPAFKPEYTPGSNPLCGSCNFSPNHVSGSFEQHGVPGSFEPPEPPSIFEGLNSWAMAQGGKATKISEMTIQADNEWDLIWQDSQPQSFHFHNCVTGATRPVPSRAVDPCAIQDAATYTNIGLDTSPGLTHKLDALEAALQAGYDHAVSELLTYNMDLNVEIFGRDRRSPLHWAVKHKNLHLVCLFLEHGANADFGGPALIQAVGIGHLAIAEALVSKTSRVACTQSLGLAVDKQDMNMARLLLDYGVHCDFEKDDRPYPQPTWDQSFMGCDISRPQEFKPPLIRAIQKHDIDIVRLLLLHGADPNVALHDTFDCGRAVQLAMKAEQLGIVQLLLDSGADISLPGDTWEGSGHKCHILKRPVYQKVTARLRAAMAAKRLGKAANLYVSG